MYYNPLICSIGEQLLAWGLTKHIKNENVDGNADIIFFLMPMKYFASNFFGVF